MRHEKLLLVLVLSLLGGCYSNLPIEFSKIDDYKELSKIKLKDRSEYNFENGESQILSVNKNLIVLVDLRGNKREVLVSDVDTFYSFNFDPIKLIFGSLWVGFAVLCLLWLGSAVGPVG